LLLSFREFASFIERESKEEGERKRKKRERESERKITQQRQQLYVSSWFFGYDIISLSV